MKLCMVVHQDYYRDSRVRRYAEALAAAGVAVDVLCVRPERPTDRASQTREGIRVYAIPLSRQYSGLASYLIEYALALVLFSIRLAGLYIRNRYAVIHVHNMPDFLVFTALLPAICGARVILDIHDPMPEFYMSKYARTADDPLVRGLRFQERLSARFAHALVTANRNFRDHLVQRGLEAAKITVVSNVPDPMVFDPSRRGSRPPTDSGRFTLIYPGTIAPRYGLDLAVRALPRLRQEIPGIELVVVGTRTAYADALGELAAELGVGECLRVKPAVPVDQVPDELLGADVGIYPALPDAHMSIAIPSKVLEYAAMGLPVVASRLPVLLVGFGEEALLLFQPGCVDEFAEGVLALYRSRERREALVRAADEVLLSRYSWPGECQKYFHLLGRLVPRDAMPPLRGERDEPSIEAAT